LLPVQGYYLKQAFLTKSFFMTRLKNTLYVSILLMLIGMTSCTPEPVEPHNGSDFLKFSNAHVYVLNAQGSSGTVGIESNIDWQLAVAPVDQSWVTIDRTNGHNNSQLTVTATTDNISGGYRFGDIIATPVNNNSLQPVHLLVVQYDSSYHTSHH
jgi:hypothetical protein